MTILHWIAEIIFWYYMLGIVWMVGHWLWIKLANQYTGGGWIDIGGPVIYLIGLSLWPLLVYNTYRGWRWERKERAQRVREWLDRRSQE